MIGALIAKQKARKLFEARNRGDLDAFLHSWADDVVYIFPGDGTMSGTFQGKTDVRRWFEQFHERFPERDFKLCEVAVARPFALGATNEVAVHWRSTLRDSRGNTTENEGVTVVYIRSGEAVRVHDFIFDLSQPFFRPDHEQT